MGKASHDEVRLTFDGGIGGTREIGHVFLGKGLSTDRMLLVVLENAAGTDVEGRNWAGNWCGLSDEHGRDEVCDEIVDEFAGTFQIVDSGTAGAVGATDATDDVVWSVETEILENDG